ncbi:MAG: c-type cytochrome [Acidobacteriota bacterium]
MKRLGFLALFLLALACNRGESAPPTTQPEGNPEHGRQLVTQYGCPVCHTIPGVEGAVGALGPTLQGVASRPALSFGAVQNTPANVARFIQNPASMNPQSSMPPISMPPADAQDIAAFLGTLH